MIVVAIVGMLASIATPTWVRARTRSQVNTCINNLKQIDGAKQQWGLETKASPAATPDFSEISGYLKSQVVCPAGGTGATFGSSYSMNSVGVKPACLIVPTEHVLPDTSQ